MRQQYAKVVHSEITDKKISRAIWAGWAGYLKPINHERNTRDAINHGAGRDEVDDSVSLPIIPRVACTSAAGFAYNGSSPRGRWRAEAFLLAT